MFSTDVLALASIAGCSALSVGATAALLDGPSHVSHGSACEVVVNEHRSGITFLREGGVIVLAPESSHGVTVQVDGDAEKCRRKRRRHRHRGEIERTREIQRALERAEHARERAEHARVRAMERRFEAEAQAMEEAARSLEAVMEGELQESMEADLRRMEIRLERMNRARRR